MKLKQLSAVVLLVAAGLMFIPLTSHAQDESLPVDSMVGQVNGKAIYANTVFEPIHALLLAKGRTETPRAFEMSATEAIGGQLQRIVIDKLMLTEAERDLTESEEQYLKFALQKEMEDMLRQLGAASRVLAEQESLRKYSMTLDEKIGEKRSEILLKRYYARELGPQIVVRRKDVERYYRDHPEHFSSPAKRTLHLLTANTEAVEDVAEQIKQRFAVGAKFLEVAADEKLNSQQPAKSGLWFEDFEGDNIPLNDPESVKQVLQLEQGAFAGPFLRGKDTVWVYIAELQSANNISFKEAQLQIERTIREREFLRLINAFRKEAYERGNYTNPMAMTEKLVAIAITRYYIVDRVSVETPVTAAGGE